MKGLKILTFAAFATLCLIHGTAGQNEVETDPEVTVWFMAAKPTRLSSIFEDQPYTVNVTLRYNGTTPLPFDAANAKYVVSISMTNPHTVTLSQDKLNFTWEDINDSVNQTLIVTGNVVGYVDLNFKLEAFASDGNAAVLGPLPVLSNFKVTVIRESALMDHIFTIVLACAAMLSTINMGCALDLNIIKANILRPVGPVVGFISQFTFMPMFSLMMALLLIADPLQGFGLLVLGCSPGGLGSNFWTLLLGGDVNLSITMTFVSIIAALGMMPLWMYLLSGFFLPPGSPIQVPYVEMSISLVTLTLPLGIGLLIRRCKPKVADFLVNKLLKPCSFVIIILIFSVGFYTLWDLLVLLDGYMLLAGLCVSSSGFIFGGLFALLAGCSRQQIIAISLETAMQNGNVAFVLLKTSLPSPYSDVASMTPIAQMLMTSSILFSLLGIVLTTRCIKRCTGKDKKKKDAIESDEGAKALMMREANSRSGNSPPPNYYGGQVTTEFAWVQNDKWIVPNSPTSTTSPTFQLN